MLSEGTLSEGTLSEGIFADGGDTTGRVAVENPTVAIRNFRVSILSYYIFECVAG